MKYHKVNKNNLDLIEAIDSETETALTVTDGSGVEHTRFGPLVFMFRLKKDAVDFADRLLDEEIDRVEKHLVVVKGKKNKLKKGK